MESEGAAAALSPSPLRPALKFTKTNIDTQSNENEREGEQYTADFEEDSQDSFLRLEAEVVQKLKTREVCRAGKGERVRE